VPSELPLPLNPHTAEGMNGSSASDDLATMPDSARYEIFFSGFHRNVSILKNQRVATLDSHHVFIVFVDVRSGIGILVARPECHLTPIGSVINVAFYTAR